jgi:hypothetical protein
MRKSWLLTAMLAVGAMLSGVAATPAAARGVVVDNGEFLDNLAFDDGCSISLGGCTAYTLPFSFNFGTGSTNQMFVYQNGFVSFGAQVATSTPADMTFDGYGVPVLAPLALTDAALFAPYKVGVGEEDFLSFTTSLSGGVGKYVIVSFDNDSSFETLEDAVWLLMRKAANGDLLVEFVHGSCFCVFDNGSNYPNTANAAFGYVVGGQSYYLTDLTEQDITQENSYRFAVGGGVTAAVPEPASWAMMIGGFGLIGATLRGRRPKARALAYA